MNPLSTPLPPITPTPAPPRRTSHDRFFQLLWRPRPPSLLSEEKQREIVKNLRKYSKRYEEEDEALLAQVGRETTRRDSSNMTRNGRCLVAVTQDEVGLVWGLWEGGLRAAGAGKATARCLRTRTPAAWGACHSAQRPDAAWAPPGRFRPLLGWPACSLAATSCLFAGWPYHLPPSSCSFYPHARTLSTTGRH